MGLVKDERKEQYTFYSLNTGHQVLKNILQEIVNNIKDYPVIKSDIEKSIAAEKYIQLSKMAK